MTRSTGISCLAQNEQIQGKQRIHIFYNKYTHIWLFFGEQCFLHSSVYGGGPITQPLMVFVLLSIFTRMSSPVFSQMLYFSLYRG